MRLVSAWTELDASNGFRDYPRSLNRSRLLEREKVCQEVVYLEQFVGDATHNLWSIGGAIRRFQRHCVKLEQTFYGVDPTRSSTNLAGPCSFSINTVVLKRWVGPFARGTR